MAEQYTVHNQQSLDACKKFITELYEKQGSFTMKYKLEKSITRSQMNSVWHYCERLSTALNDAGLDMRKVLKEEIEIPWNKYSVKECLWSPVQESMFQTQSLSESPKAAVSKVYDVLNLHLINKFNVSVSFITHPSDSSSK